MTVWTQNNLALALWIACLATLALSCAQEPATPAPALSLRPLPLISHEPLAYACRQIDPGDGLGAGGERQVGAVRLQLFAGDAPEPLRDLTWSTASSLPLLRLEELPPGEGYRVEVSACEAPGRVAQWSGAASSISIQAGQTTRQSVFLLSSRDFVCATEAAEALPPTPLAFSALWSPAPGQALVLGGLESWTGQGRARGSTAILRYDLAQGAFSTLGELPVAQAMAQTALLRPSPGEPEALLVYGGVSSLAEGDGSALSQLLHFGPPPGEALPAPLWVSAQGEVRAADLAGLPTRFGAGLGASVGQEDVLLVAGGVDMDAGPGVSGEASLVRLGVEGARLERWAMASPRIGASVVEVEPGFFLIVGGNTGFDNLEDPQALGTLIEFVDARVEPALHGQVSLQVPPSASAQDLASLRPAAFSGVSRAHSGHITVVGGLPLFGQSHAGRPVSSGPVQPVLYRVLYDAAAPGAATLAPLDQVEASQELARRALASRLQGDQGETWWWGGVADDPTSFKPAQGGLLVSLEDGQVQPASVGPPYAAVGAATAAFPGGAQVVVGGVVESGAVNLLQATNLSALWRSPQRWPCGQVQP